MNKNLKNRKGFSLIEIIVVLVIIGVLIKIALPNLFLQIQRQQAQEAMNTMAMMRSSMEACGIQNGYNFTSCNDWNVLNMSQPTGGRFTYTWTDAGGTITPANGTYYMTAKVGSSSDWIEMHRTSTGVTCTANGIYTGMC